VERWVLPKDIGTMWRPCGIAPFSVSGKPIGRLCHCSKPSTSVKWRTSVNRAGNSSKNWINLPYDPCLNEPMNSPPGKMPKSTLIITPVQYRGSRGFRRPLLQRPTYPGRAGSPSAGDRKPGADLPSQPVGGPAPAQCCAGTLFDPR
jgi:hypothetical protein